VIPNFKKQPIELSKKMPETILINQATMADLLLLPGMTKQLAARLIKYRDKIGGFKRVEQIRKTYGLSDSLSPLMLPLVVL
jgi:DNA uptake protein ComE-like DNA-binding protein